jgi:hypothetical protein
MENLDEIKGLVISKLQETYVLCPECIDMYSDDQYTCTTCWYQGGQGKLNVYSVLKENPGFLSENPFDGNFSPEQYDDFEAMTYDHVDGIPLNEEWLINLGFKKTINGDHFISLGNDKTLFLIQTKDEFYPQLSDIFMENIFSLNFIKTVYQLQNLYYCLVGKELKNLKQ